MKLITGLCLTCGRDGDGGGFDGGGRRWRGGVRLRGGFYGSKHSSGQRWPQEIHHQAVILLFCVPPKPLVVHFNSRDDVTLRLDQPD